MISGQIAILSAICIDNIFSYIWIKYILKNDFKFSPIQVFQTTYLSAMLYLFIIYFHQLQPLSVATGKTPSQVDILISYIFPQNQTITLLSSLKTTLILWLVFVAPTIDNFAASKDRQKHLYMLFGSCVRYALITLTLAYFLAQ